MQIDDLKKLPINDDELYFDYDLKKLNWFNIGGKTKVFFKAKSLIGLVNFLKTFKKRGKIFVLGAGSNVLISDDDFNGVVIKLGKNFQNLSILKENLIIAGCGISQKKLSEFSKENSLTGMEFMSCIPGSVGGGIRMNSGCFDNEFKDVLVSVQCIDFDGSVKMINKHDIKFKYRGSDLSKDLIFLSATFEGKKTEQNKILQTMEQMKNRKEKAQPTRIKTSGSTFKNPKSQTNKKVWELIKESVPLDKSFGDACISEKHCNFFVNKGSASFNDMNNLIEFVSKEVLEKTGIKLEKEIKILK